jgi:hypothetical protein
VKHECRACWPGLRMVHQGRCCTHFRWLVSRTDMPHPDWTGCATAPFQPRENGYDRRQATNTRRKQGRSALFSSLRLTSDMCQTEKDSVRADVFRVAPDSRHCSMQWALRVCDNKRLGRKAPKWPARKIEFVEPNQTDLPSPVRFQKIFRFKSDANHFTNCAISSHSEGRLAIVTDAGRDAVDAAVLLTNGA